MSQPDKSKLKSLALGCLLIAVGCVGLLATLGVTVVLTPAVEPVMTKSHHEQLLTDTVTDPELAPVVEDQKKPPSTRIVLDLEEVEFYISRRRWQEAYEILSDLRLSYGDHPMIVAMFRKFQRARRSR